MPKPSKLRRVLKWCGAAACAVTLAGYPVSYGRFVGVMNGLSGVPSRFVMATGNLDCSVPAWPFAPWDLDFVWVDFSRGAALRWLDFHLQADAGSVGFRLPLWFAFLALALPTAWLWRRDRQARIPSGHCRTCGYNLTGNVSGVCPECETRVPKGAA